MTFEETETFLAVVQNETIAHAANQLYISQGTTSIRLHIPIFQELRVAAIDILN